MRSLTAITRAYFCNYFQNVTIPKLDKSCSVKSQLCHVDRRFCHPFSVNSKHELQTCQPVPEQQPVPLNVQCLRSVVIGMERIPFSELQLLPQSHQGLFPKDFLVQATFNLWPKNIKGESAVLTIRKGMIICELKILLRQKLKLAHLSKLRVFKHGIRLCDDDTLKEDSDLYDCVIESDTVSMPLRVSPTLKEVSWF